MVSLAVSTHFTNQRQGYGFESQETGHDEDPILEFIFDPESQKEV